MHKDLIGVSDLTAMVEKCRLVTLRTVVCGQAAKPMTRIAILIMIAIACALAPPISTVQGQEAKRPNFLFIVVDDQSPFDLRIYNPASELQTPTLHPRRRRHHGRREGRGLPDRRQADPQGARTPGQTGQARRG